MIPNCPALPFKVPANCTLTFTVIYGGVIRNPLTGERSQQERSHILEAFLQIPKQSPKDGELPGNKDQVLEMEGYLLSQPDFDIQVGNIAKISRLDLPGRVITGEFEVIYFGHPYAGAIANIGIPIKGSYREVGSEVPRRS